MLNRFRNARKTVSLTLAIFVWAGLHSHFAHGDIVATDTLLQEIRSDNIQQTLDQALNRAEVVALLSDHGVSKAQAQSRVAALTDEEAAQLAAEFDNLPAGGNITLLLVIIILILLLR